VLEAFPEAEIIGIDFDPTLLCLARPRVAAYGSRARVMQADLRESDWMEAIGAPVDAAVSATSLHWLAPASLAGLYQRVAEALRPGGIFLNADHVASECPAVQKAWEQSREKMRRDEGHGDADDWYGFLDAYGAALGVDMREAQRQAVGEWDEGPEEGMPLAWHFDRLREAGFRDVDCFWRCDCDAVYGGLRPDAT
jgi:SAM-dependent methyltransferase